MQSGVGGSGVGGVHLAGRELSYPELQSAAAADRDECKRYCTEPRKLCVVLT